MMLITFKWSSHNGNNYCLLWSEERDGEVYPTEQSCIEVALRMLSFTTWPITQREGFFSSLLREGRVWCNFDHTDGKLHSSRPACDRFGPSWYILIDSWPFSTGPYYFSVTIHGPGAALRVATGMACANLEYTIKPIALVPACRDMLPSGECYKTLTLLVTIINWLIILMTLTKTISAHV